MRLSPEEADALAQNSKQLIFPELRFHDFLGVSPSGPGANRMEQSGPPSGLRTRSGT
jgi:hypothetical protein